MRILLVNSNPMTAAQLGDYLEAKGYSVDYAASTTLALRLIDAGVLDATVLVSWGSAQEGVEACRKLAAVPHNRGALLVLDAISSVPRTTAAFEAGADGYLGGPAPCVEVEAHLHAVIRAYKRCSERVLRLADLELDLSTMQARRQGQPLALSPTKVRLLQMLMEAAPRLLTFRELELRLWGGDDCDGRANANLRTLILGLRREVDRPFCTGLIHTRPAFGYRMANPEAGDYA